MDRAVWRQIRHDLRASVGEDQFSIWLAALELAGCTDGTLLLACPTVTRAWVSGRYRDLLQRVGIEHGRPTRLASDTELQVLDAPGADPAPQPTILSPPHTRQRAR